LAGIIALFAQPLGVRTLYAAPTLSSVSTTTSAENTLRAPCAVALDESDGVAGAQLLICDSDHHRIAALNPRTGHVSTVGQLSVAGFRDGFAEEAELNAPSRSLSLRTATYSSRTAPESLPRRRAHRGAGGEWPAHSLLLRVHITKSTLYGPPPGPSRQLSRRGPSA
jgi:hypothetical protein